MNQHLIVGYRSAISAAHINYSQYTYTRSASQTTGVGSSLEGPNGGFTAAGSSTSGSTTTVPFPTIHGESSNYLEAESTWDDDDLFCSNGVGGYYTTWDYQFNSVSSLYGTPGAPIVAAGKCVQQLGGHPVTYTTDSQGTWSAGANVSDDIGINLSSQDGWTTDSSLTYEPKVTTAICGVYEPPGYVGASPGYLQVH